MSERIFQADAVAMSPRGPYVARGEECGHTFGTIPNQWWIRGWEGRLSDGPHKTRMDAEEALCDLDECGEDDVCNICGSAPGQRVAEDAS